MKIFLTSVTSVILILLAVKQFISNHRTVHPDESKMKMVLWVDIAVICHIICYALSDCCLSSQLPCAIMIGLMSVSTLSMSLFNSDKMLRWVVYMSVVLEFMMAMSAFVPFMNADSQCIGRSYIVTILVCSSMLVCIYIYGIYLRLKDVKYVMKSGSVWTNVTLSVDSIYLAAILLDAMLFVCLMEFLESDISVILTIFTFTYAMIYVALRIRILNSSAFVIMTEHERKIVESMKISHVDNVQESAGTEMLYKNIYDRVLDYFNESEPYLNPNLTINDVVEVVFSNKLYISKAISQCTGRNFCQFVNYYRVIYAVELFRSNPNLKVFELAAKCGFNSVVSFGMAFRLYMGEKPGDWCRREKFRLDKLKK